MISQGGGFFIRRLIWKWSYSLLR